MFLPLPVRKVGVLQGVWMKRILAIAVAASITAAGLALAQPPAQQPPTASAGAGKGQTIDGIVASVNDQVISQSDVRSRMRWMLLNLQQQSDDEEFLLQIQQKAIEDMIDEKVQLLEFHKLVKTETIRAEEIDERIDDLARQYKMNREQFNAALAQSGIPVQHLRDMKESEIAWTALIRGRYAKSVRVSELRIDEMLERIQNSLNKPQYRLSEIFLYAPDQASRANAMTRADTLIKNINQGADFRALAQQFSAAPSAYAGGDLNWLVAGDMKPEVEAAVMKAPTPPTILPPIEADGGVYVIALLGKREASDPNLQVILTMKQVVARGEGATAKLEKVKTDATACSGVAKAIDGVEGVSSTDLKDVGLQQVNPTFRGALEGLNAGQTSALLDLQDGSKMIFYVCEKKSGDPDLPTRNEIKDRLFNAELALVAERYLRDLKREATIVRR